jgi:hypothetical protein
MSWDGAPNAYFSTHKCKGCGGWLRVKYRNVASCPVCEPIIPSSKFVAEQSCKAASRKSKERLSGYKPELTPIVIFRG